MGGTRFHSVMGLNANTESKHTIGGLVRRIAHVDMDAFFASCELSQYPELRGLPVVVGGPRKHEPVMGADGVRLFSRLRDYQGRGVLTTATYEARQLGVHSGMPTMKAAKLAPDAVLLPVNFDLYRRYSQLFKAAVATVCPVIQDVGIDELYADVSGLDGDSRSIGLRIKAAVKEATGLSCSVGLTPNKLLSKIASDLNKPDGLTILTAQDVPLVIWPLPVQKINGIGPKSADRLASMGIHTIGELAAADPARLQSEFGLHYAAWLIEVAHGRDERPVQTYSEPKSISRETTFESDLHPKRDRAVLSQAFTDLCMRLSADLHRKAYVAYTVGIKLRFDDFTTLTRVLTLPEPTDDAQAIRHAAGQCLKRIDLRGSLRLLGVKASNLERKAEGVRPTPVQGQLEFD